MSKEELPTILKDYSFDPYLMFLIQEVSNRQAAEIVNFFHELAGQVCDIGVKNKTGRAIRKKITDYFPGTSIPFHMLVKGHKVRGKWTNGNFVEGNYFSCEVRVGFPDARLCMEEEELESIAVAIMEKHLLGGDEIIDGPKFTKPEIHTPPMYKKLMDSFMNRPVVEKSKRSKKE